MKNNIFVLFPLLIFVFFLSSQTSFADSDDFLIQETYLLQKVDKGSEPWDIILPENSTIPYGKLEYVNYPIGVEVDDSISEEENEYFCFDFKGYNIPVNGTDQNDVSDQNIEFEYGPYALIYYVDPDPEEPWSPEVYVLGVTDEVWQSPAEKNSGPPSHANNGKSQRGNKGKSPQEDNETPPGHEGVNLHISGYCDIGQIPVKDDVNYPNGGKIWLVPTDYVENATACEWTTMNDWPEDEKEILFETSLITYGFVHEDGSVEE